MERTTSTAPIAVTRVARAMTYLAYAFVIVALVLLLLGLFLELFGANPHAAFAEWLYRSLRRVMAPFRGLFEPLALDGRSVLDGSILFAMLVYGIVALALQSLIGWLTARITAMRAQQFV
jgi:uncharacterized protein YggT (Ycf19 family)